MFYFMEVVSTGVEKINWARIISNNLDLQLKRLGCTKTFYMSSYIIYSLARAHEYAGLMHRCPIGTRDGEMRACESYTKLHYPSKTHFRRVNVAFTMHLTRTLQGGIHQKIIPAGEGVSKEVWCLVYSISQLRLYKSSRMFLSAIHATTLPYDKMLLLESIRQLITYDKVQKNGHKTKIAFTISIKQSIEVCPSLHPTEKSKEELRSHSLIPYSSRENFDPYSNMRKVGGRRHKHKLQLEDYWMNAQDDLEIRKKMCSRLPIDIVRMCKVFDILNQAQDSGKCLHPVYE